MESLLKKEFSASPFITEIGKGSFATVFKAIHKDHEVAIKVIELARLANKKLEWNVKSEINILKRLRHPNIVELFEVKAVAECIFIVMEYCVLGDLSDYLKSQPEGRFKEPVCKILIRQLASGLVYMQQNYHLIHRDLKPQNLLLTKDPLRNDDGGLVLKIADFGFVKSLDFGKLADTLCGSPYYMAPEILRYELYDGKVDLWSVGIITFELMFGKVPFRAANHIQLLRKIESSKIVFPFDPVISSDCKLFIQGLLQINPHDRLSLEEFACHSFVGDVHKGLPITTTRGKSLIERSSPSTPIMQTVIRRLVKEKDYIVIDKHHIELNAFADAIQNQPSLVKSRSAPDQTSLLNRLKYDHTSVKLYSDQGRFLTNLATLKEGDFNYKDLHASLMFYLMALKSYQVSFQRAKSLWLKNHHFSILGLSTEIQQTRNEYNIILAKAESLCNNLVSIDTCLFEADTLDFRAILFEKGLEMAKLGAAMEMEGNLDLAKRHLVKEHYEGGLKLIGILLDPEMKCSITSKDRQVLQSCKLRFHSKQAVTRQ